MLTGLSFDLTSSNHPPKKATKRGPIFFIKGKMEEKQAIQLLKKHANSEESYEAVLRHSQALQKLAIEIAEKIQTKHPEMNIDVEFIKVACILHDIGRFECPPGKNSYKHGVIGAKILRDEGVDERYALVCERHVGPGIPASDVERQGLDLPVKDYVPLSIEEKIITYADNLLWGDEPQPSQKIVERFNSEIDENVGARAKQLNDEIEGLMEG